MDIDVNVALYTYTYMNIYIYIYIHRVNPTPEKNHTLGLTRVWFFSFLAGV